MAGNKDKEYPNFYQVANNLELLTYDPDKRAEDGSVEIGCVQSDDSSVSRWTIVPRESGGYVLQIESVIDGYDDDYEPIYSESPNPVFFVPVKDGSGLGMDYIPTSYDSIEEAYRAFLEVVYTTEKTERAFEAKQKAHELLGGYCEPETMSFPEFKKAFEAVSLWDGKGRYEFTPIANAMLVCRYPFLISYGAMSADELPDDLFSYTRFDELPSGWAHRFGLELFEDMRNQNWDADPLVWEYRQCETRIDQIKEKFGDLRVYCSCWGQGQELIEIYSALSRNICILCGKADGVRITRGYISPYCWKDALGDRGDTYKLRAEVADKYLPKDCDWEDKASAGDYAVLSQVLATTGAASGSESVRSILDSWIVKTFSKDGEKEENRSIGLLDGTPAPNGEPVWAREVIAAVADEIADCEAWCARGFVDEDGKGPGAIASKYGAPALDWAWWSDEDEENSF